MLLARMPAKDDAVFGIRDARDFAGEAAPLGRAAGSGGGEFHGIPVRGERNRYGEAQVGAENPKIRKPADDREAGDEIFGDPLAVRGAGGGVEIAGALIKSKRVQEINARWRRVSRHLCVAGPTSSSRGKPPSSFLRATD